MLEVFTNVQAGVATPVDTGIVFNNTKVRTGVVATANTPTNTIRLNRAGFYMIHFNAVVANNTAASGDVGVQMVNNGVVDKSALAQATSTGATDFVNLAFTTIVRVEPSCSCVSNSGSLVFNITGVDALVRFANVVVTKIA